ncbi:hypothetical protein LXL04_019294 [Taraxacum kok-saghyz]
MALPNAGVVVRTAPLMVLPRPEAEVTLACRSAIHPNLPPGVGMSMALIPICHTPGPGILAEMSEGWRDVIQVPQHINNIYLEDHVEDLGTREYAQHVRTKLYSCLINIRTNAVNLDRRGIDLGTVLCPICERDVETVNHVFFTCDMALDLWGMVARWWQVDIPVLSSMSEWIAWIDSVRLRSAVRRCLDAVGLVVLWSIWMFGNKVVFNQVKSKLVSVGNILTMTMKPIGDLSIIKLECSRFNRAIWVSQPTMCAPSRQHRISNEVTNFPQQYSFHLEVVISICGECRPLHVEDEVPRSVLASELPKMFGLVKTELIMMMDERIAATLIGHQHSPSSHRSLYDHDHINMSFHNVL